MCVAVGVFGKHNPDSVPRTKVVSACVQRDHLDGVVAAWAALHDGVVDSFARDGGKFRFTGSGEGFVLRLAVPSCYSGIGYVRPERAQHL